MTIQDKSRPKGHNNNLGSVLNEAATFIRSLTTLSESTISSHASRLSDIPVLFSTAQDGTVILDRSLAQEYRACLGNLITVATKDEQISARTVEKLFQRTILATLDFRKRRAEHSFEERLTTALSKLRESINATPTVFEVYHPVAGLNRDGLPLQFGRFSFLVFDELQANKFRDTVTKSTLDEDEKQRRLETVEGFVHHRFMGQPFAVISVMAVDATAARQRANKELRLTVDAINFLSDMIPDSRGYLYLPGEAQSTSMTVPTINYDSTPSYTVHAGRVGPSTDLSIKGLISFDASNDVGLSRINDLLSKPRSRLEDRLLAALQWAGRATVDTRNEEAFLLYAIALESLILADNEKDELINRLATRVAHLLGIDVDARLGIINDVRALYKIRSSIVHSGAFEVTEANLDLARLVAKTSIVRILRDEPFRSMSTPAQLADWFNRQILS